MLFKTAMIIVNPCMIITPFILLSNYSNAYTLSMIYVIVMIDLSWFYYVDDIGLRKHQLFLHWWRMLWFVLLWGLLWFLWQTVQYSLWVSTRIQWVVGLLLLFLWLQILWFTPKFTYTSSWGNSMHAYIAKRWRKSRVTMIFGALTFLIPCWFTQMVQLTALASWSRIAGATMMWMFALWTLPWLLLLWIWTSFAKIAYKRYFERLIAVVLIIFSLNSLRWTWVILGRNDWPTWSVVQQVSQERTTIELGHDW